MSHNVPVQSLIDHIKTAVDVDPWAKEMAEELLKKQEAVEARKECDRTPQPWTSWWYVCGNCKASINPNDKYCHECGRAVAWGE